MVVAPPRTVRKTKLVYKINVSILVDKVVLVERMPYVYHLIMSQSVIVLMVSLVIQQSSVEKYRQNVDPIMIAAWREFV